MKRDNPNATSVPDVAGNGLLDRRALLGRGMFFAGAAVAGVGTASSAGAEALPVDPWSMEPGAPIPPYGVPAKYESKVVRTLTNPNNEPRDQQRADATPSPRRHDHAERPALRGGADPASRISIPPSTAWRSMVSSSSRWCSTSKRSRAIRR